MSRKNNTSHQKKDDKAGFCLSLDKLNIRLGGNSTVVILIAILSGLSGQGQFPEYGPSDSVLLIPEERTELKSAV